MIYALFKFHTISVVVFWKYCKCSKVSLSSLHIVSMQMFGSVDILTTTSESTLALMHLYYLSPIQLLSIATILSCLHSFPLDYL